MSNWTEADIKNSKVAHLNPKLYGNSEQLRTGKENLQVQTPLQRMQALGRMKAGKMNKTEAAYYKVLEMEIRTGEILNFWFEPMNLRIGENCFYKTDFLVLNKNSELELREVKGGYVTDDALIKIKIVAEKYPFKVTMVKLIKGDWHYKTY